MKLSKKDIFLLFILPLAIGEILLFTTELALEIIALLITAIPATILTIRRHKENNTSKDE